ncbi:MAG: hypothetical protein IPI66_07135 [Chitinophagaceae bacterium]|nr:hypothetical protein [Chitinophagaceae bacterium]
MSEILFLDEPTVELRCRAGTMIELLNKRSGLVGENHHHLHFHHMEEAEDPCTTVSTLLTMVRYRTRAVLGAIARHPWLRRPDSEHLNLHEENRGTDDAQTAGHDKKEFLLLIRDKVGLSIIIMPMILIVRR